MASQALWLYKKFFPSYLDISEPDLESLGGFFQLGSKTGDVTEIHLEKRLLRSKLDLDVETPFPYSFPSPLNAPQPLIPVS